MSDSIEFTKSSGNVFADLGLDQPEEIKAKVHLAHLITQIINHRHMTQKQAAIELGLTQPKVSNIMAGRIEGYSLEKLMMLMVKLDRDVEIVIKKKPKTREQAHLNVVYA
ncbi:MAG: transcriptional regulator [Desulfuromonas sp.]|nr:MAG: transcriptional regulator [Desulfuromonas sp.]